MARHVLSVGGGGTPITILPYEPPLFFVLDCHSLQPRAKRRAEPCRQSKRHDKGTKFHESTIHRLTLNSLYPLAQKAAGSSSGSSYEQWIQKTTVRLHNRPLMLQQKWPRYRVVSVMAVVQLALPATAALGVQPIFKPSCWPTFRRDIGDLKLLFNCYASGCWTWRVVGRGHKR